MFRVTVQDATLNGLATGCPEGSPAALLIHGLNTNIAFWHPRLVRQLGEDRRLILFDLRGHGYSTMPASGYTSDRMADDAAGVLDHCRESSVDVIAHSFGSAVALQLVRLHPERVRSLTLLDARLRLLQPDMKLGEWPAYPRWKKHFADVGIELDANLDLDFTLPLHLQGDRLGDALRTLEADGFFVPSQGSRTAAKYQKMLEETTAASDLKAVAGLSREFLRSLSLPMFLLYGSASPFLQTRDGLRQEIPSTRLEHVEDGGHNFPFMFPDRTADHIRAFWNGIESAPAGET